MPRINGSPTEYLLWLRRQAETDAATRELAREYNETLMLINSLELAENRREAKLPFTTATMRSCSF